VLDRNEEVADLGGGGRCKCQFNQRQKNWSHPHHSRKQRYAHTHSDDDVAFAWGSFHVEFRGPELWIDGCIDDTPRNCHALRSLLSSGDMD